MREQGDTYCPNCRNAIASAEDTAQLDTLYCVHCDTEYGAHDACDQCGRLLTQPFGMCLSKECPLHEDAEYAKGVRA